MFTLDIIRNQLQDRRIAMVARDTGLHYNTIKRIRDNTLKNPTYETIEKLSDYLKKGGVNG